VQQHYRTISRLSPVPVGILTGGMSAGERKACLKGVASGAIPILIGTHAVFQAAVSYHNLGLIVVDEMHRFGVEQRAALTAKGDRPDTLLMTATPIPRTVFLAEIGWMDCSIIKGKPAGRKPIRTTLHPVDQVPDVVAAVGRMVARGGRVYWVCPLVAENAELDLAAAEERYTKLRESFGDEVALVHGQQAPEARAAALDGFAKGRFKLLVSTTVIEVGVDVPEATVMVIEHAERFGAAQLHQLRGRIGRGNAASFCLLIHARSLGKPSFQRLKLLRDSDDGFFISEEDYRLRGGGDVMGTRQSGLPGYRLVTLDNDRELLDLAHRDAAHLLREDPDLSSTRGKAALRGLEVFGLSDVRRFLRAG
jgi:ATP-dependent DNA helicase RecG